MHRVGIAAVLPADAQIELWLHSAALFDSYPCQPSNAGLVQALERIFGLATSVNVVERERAGIVTGETAAYLGEVGWCRS